MADQNLRVAFIVADLRIAGGVNVIVNHARQIALGEPDVDVTLVVGSEEALRTSQYDTSGIDVVTLEDTVSRPPFDVVIATWWESAYDLFEIPGRKYAYFVQSLEDRFYEKTLPFHRLATQLTYSLPVAFITEASWIGEYLREIRPDAPCFVVPNGVDKEIFASPEAPPREDSSEALRVLIEGNPYVWFKGVPEAVRAAGDMREPSHVTLVTPKPYNDWDFDVDRVLCALTQPEMADIYSDSDVLLKLSRVEGMFGPPLEGFHKGATCVVTPVTGHDEYVKHGRNGVVTDFDDVNGAARALDLLAKDREYLRELRRNALDAAASWPGWPQAARTMSQAIRDISSGGYPGPVGGGRLSMRSMRAARELLVQQNLDSAALELEQVKRKPAYRILTFLGLVRYKARRAIASMVPTGAKRARKRASRRLRKRARER